MGLVHSYLVSYLRPDPLRGYKHLSFQEKLRKLESCNESHKAIWHHVLKNTLSESYSPEGEAFLKNLGFLLQKNGIDLTSILDEGLFSQIGKGRNASYGKFYDHFDFFLKSLREAHIPVSHLIPEDLILSAREFLVGKQILFNALLKTFSLEGKLIEFLERFTLDTLLKSYSRFEIFLEELSRPSNMDKFLTYIDSNPGFLEKTASRLHDDLYFKLIKLIDANIKEKTLAKRRMNNPYEAIDSWLKSGILPRYSARFHGYLKSPSKEIFGNHAIEKSQKASFYHVLYYIQIFITKLGIEDENIDKMVQGFVKMKKGQNWNQLSCSMEKLDILKIEEYTKYLENLGAHLRLSYILKSSVLDSSGTQKEVQKAALALCQNQQKEYLPIGTLFKLLDRYAAMKANFPARKIPIFGGKKPFFSLQGSPRKTFAIPHTSYYAKQLLTDQEALDERAFMGHCGGHPIEAGEILKISLCDSKHVTKVSLDLVLHNMRDRGQFADLSLDGNPLEVVTIARINDPVGRYDSKMLDSIDQDALLKFKAYLQSGQIKWSGSDNMVSSLYGHPALLKLGYNPGEYHESQARFLWMQKNIKTKKHHLIPSSIENIEDWNQKMLS